MENLADIYAEMCRLYSEEYSLRYAAVPSYLKQIIGHPEGANIFIFREVSSKGAPLLSSASPSKNSKKEDNELDMTGSPLKDECITETIADVSINLSVLSLNPWSWEEECHTGLPINEAREIAMSSSFKFGKLLHIQGSIWILCNGQDNEKTLLLQHEFIPGFNSRGLITFVGVMSASEINAQHMLQQHNSMIRPKCRVETCIENTYEIKSNVSIRCSWNTVAAVPSLIDLNICDVVLTQRFSVNTCNPSMEEFMNQLRILMIIRDDILSYKREHDREEIGVILKEPVYRCGRGIDSEELHDSINKVMTEISGFMELSDLAGGGDYDIEAVVQRARLRCLTDLTDKLWNILRCCSSYKDLKLAFVAVFQCAARFNIVNTPTNTNRLAEIITEIANRRLAIPCLSGSEPLELLLEIGLEKLYKDYEFILVESKICSANDLKKKMSTEVTSEDTTQINVRKSIRNALRVETTSTRKTFLHNNVKSNNATKFNNDSSLILKNSNFNETETSKKLAELLQLHCTLEHLLMIQINLNLNNVVDVCDQLLKKPARAVMSIDNNLIDEIEIILSAHDVRELLESKDPQMRRITFKSDNKFRHTKTTFVYSMENIFPPNISKHFHSTEEDRDKECIKSSLYYCWLYRKLKTVCPISSVPKINNK